ncbi:hypothetical protein [Undibacterium sp.]|uniref:RIFT barrel domain-containing protein n=1 Tax=Undibacterium sp. TaxID=1914977 RepID=UPI002BC03604|nr:hypothetical protein [Undibacterium sp.]HTD05647.1 hypothetical protein [Undibacterium sp.]
MKFKFYFSKTNFMNVLSVCSFSVLLLACGGGGGSADAGSISVQVPSFPPASPVVIPPVVTPPTVTPPVVIVPPVITPPVNPGDVVITNVRIQNTGTVSTTQTNVPVTFGHIFAQGDLPNANTLYGKLSDGTVVPLQVDVKAKHADGSVRHAIISSMLTALPYNQTLAITLIKAATPAASAAGATPAALLAAGFTAGVNVTLNGQQYTASADSLLKAGQAQSWLSGSLVNEWLVSAPLKNAQGVAHPHLTARFAIRSYTGLNKARVDVTLENNWAYEPNPQDFTYDAQILVGGQSVYSKAALTHYNHARWRKIFWWGTAPLINIQHNTGYLIASKAVPNYDQSFLISLSALSSLASQFSGPAIEPMGPGLATPYMGQTGGRPDMALLPGWAAIHLLSMDMRARDAALGTADLAGSWPVHYRDKLTDKPISIKDYPYATTNRRTTTINPATNKDELLPAPATTGNPNSADSAHEPGFAYLPYLLTGDYYYLEELQFWATYNMVIFAGAYRNYDQGLFKEDQIRGQAWDMRTLGEVAYITPDADTLKNQFVAVLSNNLDWYNSQYTNNAGANSLGVIVNGYALEYNNGIGMAPWQDDFFTSAVGHVAELGFPKANSLLAWKAKFSISRMTGPGFCWIDGAIYSLNIRSSNTTSSYYQTIAEAYNATEPTTLTSLLCNSPAMAAFFNLQLGEMTGYSTSNTGYPSNMQPALAYSATSGAPGGADAWKVFMGRSVKPDYSSGPQFAIIPRQ